MTANGNEIITIPFVVWQAPVGTAFPALDVVDPTAEVGSPPAPTGWVLMGLNGFKNMTEKGITISHTEKIETDPFRTLGDTGAWQAIRSSEDLSFEFELMDATLETYAMALGVGPFETDADDIIKAVAASTSVVGTKSMGLYRGINVAQVALLVRGPSPYLLGAQAQWEIPRCFQAASPKATVSKKDAFALSFTMQALMDQNLPDGAGDSQYFGRLRAMTHAKLPSS